MHPRVVATFALIPITFGTIILAYVLIDVVLDALLYWGSWATYGLGLVFSLTPVFVFYGGGLLIWWNTVEWTARKRRAVLLTTAILVLAVGLAATSYLLNDILAMVLTSTISLIGGGVALVVVGWICYTPPHERTTRDSVPCPQCGYDLRGQRECRCPECGGEFTVGQLRRGQEEAV
jgi:hypothetical protein